ncbi:MAG TPA: hypothetical protein VJS38_12240 [Phenylobacterium sp.]|uniref:hypothetical protein n=1 Tax=Phenylobacterium sp. TaxID=1871053 RepID=UPI002B4A9299|nr:hypothetical protein [Phenylobacterium sp.]HKR88931.1 hypothetical protein [Phenylobacterium sp.]
MRASPLIAGAAAAALGLAGCNKPAGSQICTPFAAATPAAVQAPAPGALQPAAVATDPASVLDDCLHRWGYTLAASSDRAQEVAMAVVAACSPALTRWNQQMIGTGAQGAAQGQAPAEPAPSLLTGQNTTPIAEHYNYAQGRALFYVVQGRAGKCAPPPAATKAR